MADQKEISILLLGIVAVLAIVGLVLLFSSRMATGRMAAFPDSRPDIIIIPIEYPCDSLPPCDSDGRPPVDLQKQDFDPKTGIWYRKCECLIWPPTEGPVQESPIDVSKIPRRL